MEVYILMCHIAGDDASSKVAAVADSKERLIDYFKEKALNFYSSEDVKKYADNLSDGGSFGEVIGEDDCWWIVRQEMLQDRKNKKMTYEELLHEMREHNKIRPRKGLSAVIVFAEDAFDKEYSLGERSYRVTNDNKGFGDYYSSSIMGKCLGNSEEQIRLDWHLPLYIGKEHGWKVDYCYIEDDFHDIY